MYTILQTYEQQKLLIEFDSTTLMATKRLIVNLPLQWLGGAMLLHSNKDLLIPSLYMLQPNSLVLLLVGLPLQWLEG